MAWSSFCDFDDFTAGSEGEGTELFAFRWLNGGAFTADGLFEDCFLLITGVDIVREMECGLSSGVELSFGSTDGDS